jgi:lipoyl(octanoyl) transferase
VAAHRLIIDPPATGPWNMAVDEALLSDAVENDLATLRLYKWSEPTLSLGYFQRYDERHQHAASRDCAVVRRQTGGGAILHDRELTYSLTLPTSHPLAQHSQQLYTAVHDAFIAALATSLGAAQSQWNFVRRDQESSLPPRREPFLCFQRRAPGDVILLPASAELGTHASKILGSAQRRHRGAILQHGSLLLQKSPAAPELPGLGDLVGELSARELTAALTVGLQNVLSLRFVPTRLPAELESKARGWANPKYASQAWTKRR